MPYGSSRGYEVVEWAYRPAANIAALAVEELDAIPVLGAMAVEIRLKSNDADNPANVVHRVGQDSNALRPVGATIGAEVVAGEDFTSALLNIAAQSITDGYGTGKIGRRTWIIPGRLASAPLVSPVVFTWKYYSMKLEGHATNQIDALQVDIWVHYPFGIPKLHSGSTGVVVGTTLSRVPLT